MAIAKRSRTELATQRFEYAPAPESTDHVKIEKRYDLFIGGRMVKAHSQKRFPTINPSNEEKLSEVVEADEVDVDRAVKAADKAFEPWAHLAPAQRARYLFRISRLIQERSRPVQVHAPPHAKRAGGEQPRLVRVPVGRAYPFPGGRSEVVWNQSEHQPVPGSLLLRLRHLLGYGGGQKAQADQLRHAPEAPQQLHLLDYPVLGGEARAAIRARTRRNPEHHVPVRVDG